MISANKEKYQEYKLGTCFSLGGGGVGGGDRVE